MQRVSTLSLPRPHMSWRCSGSGQAYFRARGVNLHLRYQIFMGAHGGTAIGSKVHSDRSINDDVARSRGSGFA
jgi:hypothetical protein